MRKGAALSVLMAIVTLLAVAGGFASFQRKRSTFERLDFRYHWDRSQVVVETVDPGSKAEASGIRAGDRIWVVGGTPVSEIDGLKKTLRRIGPVDVLIARGDDMVTVRYEAPEAAVDYNYLFLSFIAFLYLAIGLFTFFRSQGTESLIFYLVTLFTFIVYLYSPAGRIDTLYKVLYLTEDFARIFLPPLTLHFFLRFPRPLIERKSILAALYILPGVIALWVIDIFGFDNAIGIAAPERSLLVVDRWEMLHFAIYFTLAFVALTYTYKTTAATGAKKQIQWIYLGMGAGFIPFLVLYLVPFILRGSGTAYTTIAVLPLALIPLAFAVSILKYKLWDVEVVIKEVLAYTVTFLFGMIAFSTVNMLLTQRLAEHLAMERNFLAFTSGLLIAGILVPMKSRVETLIEMLVYRDTYKHRKAMNEFVYELATFHDLSELIDSVRQRLLAAIEVEKTNLYFRDGASFVVYTEEAGMPHEISQSVFGDMLESGPLVLDRPRLPDASGEVAEALLRAGFRYVFPLRFRNRLEGMLVCGGKKGGGDLSSDDISLVGSLAAPVALAIENARLYGRLRRQIEEIVSLKEYNENIIESSSSAIVVVANDGTLLTANQAFWSLVGVSADNDLTIGRLFAPYHEVMEAPSRSAAELRYTNHLGEEKYLNVTASPFRALDVPEGTSVLVITDITERVRLERQLQEKDRLASLGLLAAGVAHEVNTPLTGISSYAQMLLSETAPDDPRYDLLKKMEQQTFRASHIVNNLLDFAANRSRLAERVSLREVITSTVSLHEVLLRGKKIALHVGDLPETIVEGNFYELQQVLTNLLLNARDAVRPGGNIWVTLVVESATAVMSVRDDGCGIPREMQKEIFKPLVTGRRGQGGTGLGLAVSDRIIRALGGSITVSSEPGEGAEFQVRIPLLEAASDNLSRAAYANPDRR